MLYWPESHVVLQIDDDPLVQKFDPAMDPQATVVHITTAMAHDQDAMIEVTNTLADLMGLDRLEVTDEWRMRNAQLRRALGL